MPKSTAPTIRSLAAELGIAPITVSRALRDNGQVRPQVRKKVLQLAKQRGYRADPVVSEVMGGLGRRPGTRYRETVAFVWTHPISDANAEEAGARSAAETLGYRLEVIKPWLNNLKEKDVSRILHSRGIRGVLLGPNASKTNPRYELDWAKFAAVLVGSSLVNDGLPRVARDYYNDAKLALAELRDAGFSRVGLSLDVSTHERTDRRYAAAFALHGGLGDGEFASRFFLRPQDCPEKIARWAKQAKVDVVLADFPWCRRWLPTDMPFASLMLRAENQECGGIRADFQRVGAEAMRLLDGLLRINRLGLHDGPTTLLVPGVWTESAATPSAR